MKSEKEKKREFNKKPKKYMSKKAEPGKEKQGGEEKLSRDEKRILSVMKKHGEEPVASPFAE